MSIDSIGSLTPRELPGVLVPGDAGYDEARVSFNGMLDRRPAAIVPCATTADVVAAVQAARAASLPIAIRGGGHSVAGHCFADDALVISLTPMRGVTIDPDRRLADAGGGALWDDLDAAAFAHGLAVTGGTVGNTGIGGLTLGGGLGWLLPVMGWTCDNLVEAEVVTANGDVVIAGPDGDPELLWALRGGGGNFGVVTRFTYQLRPVGPMFGGHISYPISAAREVYVRAQEVIERWPTACLPLIAIGAAEDGEIEISFALAAVDGTAGPDIAETLRHDLPVRSDDTGPRTYLEIQALNGTIPFGLRNYWKGHFIRELDLPTFEALVASVGDAVGDGFVMLEAITGAGRTEPPGGAAFGQRGAAWNASAISIWESPELDEAAIAWSRRVAELLEPWSLNGAAYVNYSSGDEPPERVRAMYGPERWERLVRVKQRLDPDNVFRFNHNIRAG